MIDELELLKRSEEIRNRMELAKSLPIKNMSYFKSPDSLNLKNRDTDKKTSSKKVDEKFDEINLTNQDIVRKNSLENIETDETIKNEYYEIIYNPWIMFLVVIVLGVFTSFPRFFEQNVKYLGTNYHKDSE